MLNVIKCEIAGSKQSISEITLEILRGELIITAFVSYLKKAFQNKYQYVKMGKDTIF